MILSQIVKITLSDSELWELASYLGCSMVDDQELIDGMEGRPNIDMMSVAELCEMASEAGILERDSLISEILDFSDGQIREGLENMGYDIEKMEDEF